MKKEKWKEQKYGFGESGSLIRSWQECEMVQPHWKTGSFLVKLNLQLTYNQQLNS